jgi:hypothetical protein
MLIVLFRARLVKWVTENNRPTNIVNDRELEQLLTAGRPHIKIPSSTTVSRDIEACFKKCRERIGKLLKDHPGRVHIASDAWTSPNHRAFIAWTVHLEHEGQMLAFLLDMVEIPEVTYFLILLLFIRALTFYPVSFRRHNGSRVSAHARALRIAGQSLGIQCRQCHLK